MVTQKESWCQQVLQLLAIMGAETYSCKQGSVLVGRCTVYRAHTVASHLDFKHVLGNLACEGGTSEESVRERPKETPSAGFTG